MIESKYFILFYLIIMEQNWKELPKEKLGDRVIYS